MVRGGRKGGQQEWMRPADVVPPGYDAGRYARPSVACDVVIVRFADGRLQVLLIERHHDPYASFWALPGGFVEIEEPLEEAAAREAEEETGLRRLRLIQLGAYGEPGRDPRGRVISVAYMALIRGKRQKPRAGDDARRAEWFHFSALPELAFDHSLILRDARRRLRELAEWSSALFDLLPPYFRREDLWQLCREVGGEDIPARLFARRMRQVKAVVPAGENAEGERVYKMDRRFFSRKEMFYLFHGSAPGRGGR